MFGCYAAEFQEWRSWTTDVDRPCHSSTRFNRGLYHVMRKPPHFSPLSPLFVNTRDFVKKPIYAAEISSTEVDGTRDFIMPWCLTRLQVGKLCPNSTQPASQISQSLVSSVKYIRNRHFKQKVLKCIQSEPGCISWKLSEHIDPAIQPNHCQDHKVIFTQLSPLCSLLYCLLLLALMWASIWLPLSILFLR